MALSYDAACPGFRCCEDSANTSTLSIRRVNRCLNSSYILDFSKIEAGKFTLQTVSSISHATLQEVIRRCIPAQEKGSWLLSSLDPAPPETVLESGRLRHGIVVNRLQMPSNSPAPAMSLLRLVDVNRQMRVLVAHFGLGSGLHLSRMAGRIFDGIVQEDGSAYPAVRGKRSWDSRFHRAGEPIGGCMWSKTNRSGKGKHFSLHGEPGPFASSVLRGGFRFRN